VIVSPLVYSTSAVTSEYGAAVVLTLTWTAFEPKPWVTTNVFATPSPIVVTYACPPFVPGAPGGPVTAPESALMPFALTM